MSTTASNTFTLSGIFGVIGYTAGEAWCGALAMIGEVSSAWIPVVIAIIGVAGPPIVKWWGSLLDADIAKARAEAAKVPRLLSEVARLEFSLEIARKELVKRPDQDEGKDALPPKGWLDN